MEFPKQPSAHEVRKFRKYLLEHGNLEELPPHSEWEVFRFRYSQGVLIITRNKAGFYRVNTQDVLTCWEAFKDQHNKKPFPFRDRIRGNGGRHRQREALEKRDGTDCFYCGLFMPVEDRTVEHLFALGLGGKNRLENMALAHTLCNNKADRMCVVQKVLLRERMRAANNKGEKHENEQQAVAGECGAGGPGSPVHMETGGVVDAGQPVPPVHDSGHAEQAVEPAAS